MNALLIPTLHCSTTNSLQRADAPRKHVEGVGVCKPLSAPSAAPPTRPRRRRFRLRRSRSRARNFAHRRQAGGDGTVFWISGTLMRLDGPIWQLKGISGPSSAFRFHACGSSVSLIFLGDPLPPCPLQRISWTLVQTTFACSRGVSGMPKRSRGKHSSRCHSL
ncbi:hypothetical protein BDW22DRAFT_600019 [Trametopsis cervina]|nr:hypothetical protein BDW22DRAFT_600019 [Trametopsis cervina]